MSRTLALSTADTRRVRRDPRFQAALVERIPSPGWRSQGLCLQHDPELFFPNSAEDPSPALAVCGRCPVQGACLAAALDAGECDGVWGGTTSDERRSMRHVWLTDAQRMRT